MNIIGIGVNIGIFANNFNLNLLRCIIKEINWKIHNKLTTDNVKGVDNTDTTIVTVNNRTKPPYKDKYKSISSKNSLNINYTSDEVIETASTGFANECSDFAYSMQPGV